MERINLRLLFPLTQFYEIIKHSTLKKTITYQRDRILIYLFDENDNLINMYILHFKFNLTNTKCHVEIIRDGKYLQDEIVYIDRNRFAHLDVKTKTKKR